MDATEARKKNNAMIDYLIHADFLRSPHAIDAFNKNPRHLFVAKDNLEYAYEDMALPLIKGSTVSQPSTAAVMIELLQPDEGNKILEIGAGSGWMASILSMCVGEKGRITSIEIDSDVAELAKKNLAKTGSKNVEVICDDGSVGYQKHAPYDKIIYTVATPEVPMQVLLQLKDGGRVVAPVGPKASQIMKVLEKKKGKITEKECGVFQFVPLKGQLGY